MSAGSGRAQRRRTGAHGERGAVAVELVVIIPSLVLIIGLLVAGGRIWLARQAVEGAAASAARSASLARSPGEARAAADESARSNLDTQGVRCAPVSVSTDVAGFAVVTGAPASVTSSISCTVSLADVAVPGLPGSMTLTGTASSALDTFRTR